MAAKKRAPAQARTSPGQPLDHFRNEQFLPDTVDSQHPVADEDPEDHIGEAVPDPWLEADG